MRAEHDVNRACECGSTLKLSSLPSHQSVDQELVQVWELAHSGRGHEPCSIVEARQIRYNGNRRLTYNKKR